MADKDIWYSSTLGYEGAGAGINTNEVFNAIQRLLKLYAPTATSSPTMMIGNKQSSFNVDTQLTHIEQTFAVKIKESMVNVLEAAIKSFFAENSITKNTNTYKVFSQGIVPSVTKPLSYLTQSNAIAEAQREIAGSMAQIYTQGGKPYITALGANQAEISRISQGGFASLIPSARTMQHEYNIEQKRIEAERLAEIDRKQRTKEASDNIKLINSQITTAHKEADRIAKEDAARVAAENAALVSGAESNRAVSNEARLRYARRSHGQRYSAWRKAIEENRSAVEEAREEEIRRREAAELDIRVRNSKMYQETYGAAARQAYYQEQSITRARETAREEEVRRRDLEELGIRVRNSKFYQSSYGKAARQAYYKSRHDARKFEYDWRNDALDNALSRAIESEEDDRDTLSPAQARIRERRSNNRDLKIEANRKEDLRSKDEQHKDKLRVFGKVSAGITLLITLVSKILSAIGSVYKAAGAAGVETFSLGRTARNMGVDPFELYRLSNLAMEKGLNKDIFTNAYSGLSSIFGSPLDQKQYDIFKNAGFDIVLGNSNIGDLIASSFSGKSPDAYARTILNAYLKRYQSGKLLNGESGTPQAVRKQLYDSLMQISPELAQLFGAAIDEGTFTFDEFIYSSHKGKTGYSSFDNTKLSKLGEAINTFNAFWDETKYKIFSELSDNVKKLVGKTTALIEYLNKQTRYTNRIDAIIANKEGLKQAGVAKANVKAAALAALKGRALKTGEVLGSPESIMETFESDEGLMEFLLNNEDTSLREYGYAMSTLNEYMVDTKKRIDEEKLEVVPFSAEDIVSSTYNSYFKATGDLVGSKPSGIYPSLKAAKNAFIMSSGSVALPSWALDKNGNLIDPINLARKRLENYKEYIGDSVDKNNISSPGARNTLIGVARRMYLNNILGKTPEQSKSYLEELANFMLSFSLTRDEVFSDLTVSGNTNLDSAQKNTIEVFGGLIEEYNKQVNAEKVDSMIRFGISSLGIPGLGADYNVSDQLKRDVLYYMPDLANTKESNLERLINIMKGEKISINISMNGKDEYSLETDLSASPISRMLKDYQSSSIYNYHTSIQTDLV